LVETPEHIAPVVGLQWASSAIAPLGMADEANEEANDLLGIALCKNPMLADKLREGCLTFCADDWQAMSTQQELFVPVHSRVYQQGLSIRGAVKLGPNYFRPVAPANMQNLLGCDLLNSMMTYLYGVHSDKAPDTTEKGVMYASLTFFENMLDQIMDVQCRTACGGELRHLIEFVEDTLKRYHGPGGCTTFPAWSGTALCEIACRVMYQITNKLDIPVYETAPPESPAVWNGEYMNTAIGPNFMLYVISKTQLDACLFHLLRSVPLETERQCRTTFYASNLLVNIAKIRVMKYPANKHGQSVDIALGVARKHGSEDTLLMPIELLHSLAVLQGCCA